MAGGLYLSARQGDGQLLPERGPMMRWRLMAMAGLGLFGCAVAFSVQAEVGRKPTAQEIAAIRACAAKYRDDLDEGERKCLFNLVATPCSERPANAGNLDQADCYRVEWTIWDELLNENFKDLAATLDGEQMTKLRAMQRAWIAYRDTTCNFYMDKAQGTMAIPMGNACAARETARRASC